MTDEQAVARLETLLKTQAKPAPWQPVTDYTYAAREQAEGKHPNLIRDVLKPSSVLDAGCGPGHLVRMLVERGIDARGVDAVVWREWLESPRFAVHALETMRTSPFGGTFDLVICREVLEHLRLADLRQVIANLVRMSKGYVYVTTRFAKAPDHLLAVDTADDLDPTHITMLTKPFLRTLFVLEGCTSRPDLEAQLDWQGKGRCLVFEVPH